MRTACGTDAIIESLLHIWICTVGIPNDILSKLVQSELEYTMW